jgi:hypothetical protein
LGVLSGTDAVEEQVAPALEGCQDRVAGGECTGSDQQMLEMTTSAGVEHGLKAVESVGRQHEFAPGYAAEDNADLVVLVEPVEGRPWRRGSRQSLKQRSESGSAAICFVAE